MQQVSRCVTPRATDLLWRDYPDGHAAVDEIKRWLTALPQAVRDDAMGQIVAKRRLGARGQLLPYDSVEKSGDVRFIATKSFLWEIRWSIEGKELRQYHGEPVGMEDHLIATHFHLKKIESTRDGTFDAQQEEIRLAHERYSSGASFRWGCNCAL